MKSLYCTSDLIGTETGGGIVTFNELQSLKQISESVKVLSRSELDPSKLSLPDSPFVFDYVADARLFGAPTERYDLAHFYSGTFSKTIRRLRDAGTKISYTTDAHDPKRSQEEFQRLGITYNFPHMTDKFLWSSYLEGYLSADLVICPSSHSANVVKSFGCKNVVIIPHGINLSMAKNCIPIKESDPFNAGYLGQIGPDKGLPYLIEAWKILNLQDAYLKMAGPYNELLRPLVRAKGGGLVELMGFVDRVDKFYNSVTVQIQPSTTEGFGLEVLEAMLFGRPVIVSEGAGAADVVTNGLDGFVVPIRDPNAIADRIMYLKKNRDKLIEMGLAARRKAEKYTWDSIRPAYGKAWQNLLGIR